MMLKAVATAVLAAILGYVLSELGYRGKRLFSTVAILSLFFFGVAIFLEVISPLEAVITKTGIGEAARCAVKIVGAGYVFGIASDVCREMGEGGIANALTTVGRLEIFVAVLPYILKMVELGAEMIK